MILVVLGVVLVVLGVVLVVLGGSRLSFLIKRFLIKGMGVYRDLSGSLYDPYPLLQTARFRTPGELQTRDLVQNDRLDVLYLPVGSWTWKMSKNNQNDEKTVFFWTPKKS